MSDTLSLKQNRASNINRNTIMYLLSFFIPTLITLITFAAIEVHPFGDRMILTVDCYHQYVPFLIELRNKLVSGDSLFYTWNDGLGTEYFAAFANYCSSPLNILSVFFTAKTMPDFVMFITCIRAGLASLFMTIFLSDSEKRNPDYITIAFSLMYALCGWFLTDFWNIMWCDAVALLPLICYGLRKLIKDGKYPVYVISLFIALFSNYYTGYFICLFLVFYAPIMYITEYSLPSEADLDEKNIIGIKSFFVAAGRFVLGSLLAGAMSAIITIPTFLTLQNSSATGAEFTWDFKLQDTFFDFLGRFMVSANPNIRDGMANVYSGTLSILLVPLFFLAPKITKIKIREKISYAFILILLYLSFTNRTLIFVWHGFHFPNQIPHRESFLMSFILVYLGFRVIRSIRAFDSNDILRVLFCVVAFIILYEKIGQGNESYIQYLASLIIIPIAAFMLKAIKENKRKSSTYYTKCIIAFVVIEYLIVCPLTIFTVAKNETFPSYSNYAKNDKLITQTANELELLDGHRIFERTEIYPNSICCEQSVYDVKGLSIFSSTARESFAKYFMNLGFHNNGINSVRTAGLSRPTATILGIRNAITKNLNDSAPMFLDRVKDVDDLISVYENPDALSLGFMISREILTYEPESTNNAFLKLNGWIRSMGVNSDVFSGINTNVGELTGASFSGDSEQAKMINFIGNEKAVINFSIDNATVGSDLYIFANANFGGNAKVMVNGKETSFEIRSNQIISLGTFTGEPVAVSLSYSSPKTGIVHYYFYELDMNAYDEMLNTLGDNQLNVTSYDSTHITGDINTSESGLLFLSIPYSEGFKAYVDGKSTEIIPIGDALCSIELSEGNHHIELSYAPRNFKEAVIISVIAVLVLILVCILSNKMHSKKVKVLATDNSMENIANNIEETDLVTTLEENNIAEPSNVADKLSLEENASDEGEEINKD